MKLRVSGLRNTSTFSGMKLARNRRGLRKTIPKQWLGLITSPLLRVTGKLKGQGSYGVEGVPKGGGGN